MTIRLFLVFVLVALGARAAEAHVRSQSFSSWTVSGNTLEGVYQVDAYRVTQLSEKPADLAGLLVAHLDGRVSATQDGVACKRTALRPLAAPRGEMRVEFAFSCPKAVRTAEVQLTIGGFFGVSISHVHYVRVGYPDGRIDEVVLTQGQQIVVAGPAGATGQNSLVSLFVLGFEHVLSGLDHIAFLVALMMLAGGVRQTIWAVTGFTLGHSVTLGLVAMGVLRPDTAAIEAIIGFTVAWAAGDALARARGLSPVPGIAGAIGVVVMAAGAASLGLLQVPLVVMLGLAGFAGAMALARRVDAGRTAPAVATLFGLAHGAGFAGPLLELKIAPENLVWTLLSFNLGVEAGQLVAVGVVAAFMAGLRAARIRLPGIALELSAALLFGLGVFWFVSRSIG
jgi:hypothetical protein